MKANLNFFTRENALPEIRARLRRYSRLIQDQADETEKHWIKILKHEGAEETELATMPVEEARRRLMEFASTIEIEALKSPESLLFNWLLVMKADAYGVYDNEKRFLGFVSYLA